MNLQGVRSLLFDLDGTLLGLDIDAFVPVYFEALARRFDGILPAGRLVEAILASTWAMVADRDLSRSNEEVFWSDFLPRVGLERERLDPIFTAFYRDVFPSLGDLARPVPEARRVLGHALSRGYRLVLATNPLFPRVAIVERMRWGGIHDIPFALVTAYEDMHACKPQPEYYREILQLLGASPEECLMVGNDVQEDLAASLVGIRTFLVEGPFLRDKGHPRYEPDLRGTLLDLASLL
ncbi:MAG: HAD family hydrolase [Bacillota bacterium]|nr:HAD family hydrolase [Bacillota bacterium]